MFDRPSSGNGDSSWDGSGGSSDNSSVLTSSDEDSDNSLSLTTDSSHPDDTNNYWWHSDYSIVRRRNGNTLLSTSVTPSSEHDDSLESTTRYHDQFHRNHHDHQHRNRWKDKNSTNAFSLTLHLCILISLGCVTIVGWTQVLTYHRKNRSTVSNPTLSIRDRTKLRTQQSAKHSSTNTGSSTLAMPHWLHSTPTHKDKTFQSEKEALPEGCERPTWQNANYVNCNNFHEIDMTSDLSSSYYNTPRDKTSHTLEQSHQEPNLRYIASGLWRSAWAVQTAASSTTPIVLKMMEMKHEINDRNFDRHRRDAITMERLTSNPYVIDAYGYCGNSVLTEYVPMPLDELVMADEINELGSEHNPVVTPITGRMRVQWALDVTKGVQALHDIKGGPIVHADLQTKQFLVSPVTGKVKINDFNRCRFMAHKGDTACTFRVPSSPGKMRSPEEYSYSDLDEKIDIYSLGNVLYNILTKTNPRDDYSSAEAKSMIRKGILPKIEFKYKDIPESIQLTLVKLIERTYDRNPKQRISAAALGSDLQKLLDRLGK